MPSPALTLFCAFLVGLSSGLFARQDEDQARRHFETRIRPLLAEHCYACHAAREGERKGGLELDSRAGWERGGAHGPALVPGDIDASRLIRAVRHEEGLPSMPPGRKLGAREIADLEAWVRDGAFDPRVPGAPAPHDNIDMRAAAAHHAYRPLRAPAPPAHPFADRRRGAIDDFVFARLAAAGLAPAPEADPATLLRRATQALVGLPPTVAQRARLAAAPTEETLAALVEELLASPHFGEKQGRAWLDLARYADSNGLDENLAHGEAWRYRDWVVRAVNEDLPLDEFMSWQIAGDLIAAQETDEGRRIDQHLATGFLVLGPKMLAEQDKDKLALDVVDEQMDVAFRAIMGTTIGCARCHDHKFDPITDEDYYAAAGIFRSTSTMQSFSFVSSWREVEVAAEVDRRRRRAWEEERDAARKALAARRDEARRRATAAWRDRVPDYLAAALEARPDNLIVEAEDFSRGNLRRDDARWGNKWDVVVHTEGSGEQFVEYDLTLPRGGAHDLEIRAAALEARPMKLVVNGAEHGEPILARTTGGWMPPHLRWGPAIRIALRAGRNVIRLERVGAVPHLDKIRLRRTAAAEPADLRPEVLRQWLDLLHRAERAPDAALWPLLRAADGPEAVETLRRAFAEKEPRLAGVLVPLAWRDVLRPAVESGEGLAALRAAYVARWRDLDRRRAEGASLDPEAAAEHARIWGDRGAMRRPAELGDEDLDAAEREAISSLEKALKAIEEREFRLPRAMAVIEGPRVELPLHRRGNHLDLADLPLAHAAPRFFAERVPAPPMPKETSGRLELARWMTDDRQGLTARVTANRIWIALFGRGLVTTPSNFGLNGAAPSHPELLDHLALRLVELGWSRKALMREILASATWRMSSLPAPAARAAAQEIDPEGRLYWRHPRRRLDAEAVRDSILAVSGRLDRRIGGRPFEVKNRAYVTNDQSRDTARYVSARRSLYLPVIRNAVYDLFSTFDFNDPSAPLAQRPSTVAPHQSLLMMNAPLVIESARALVESLGGEEAEARATLDALHRRILGRAATAVELARALRFVAGNEAEGETRLESLTAFAQVLMASNEFLYVD